MSTISCLSNYKSIQYIVGIITEIRNNRKSCKLL